MSAAAMSPPPEWDLILSAAQKNDAARIRQLVTQTGVDASHANGVGQSALHIAALWGHAQAVQELLSLKAKVNTRNNLTGATPLHMAVQSHKSASKDDKETVIDLLLQNGANASVADNYGSLPVDYIAMGSNTATALNDSSYVERLTNKLQPRAPPVFQAIQDHDIGKVKEALSSNNSTSSGLEGRYKGHTPLTAAIQALCDNARSSETQQQQQVGTLVEITKLLIANGSNVNAISTANDFSQPPLVQILELLKKPLASSSDTTTKSLKELVILLNKNMGDDNNVSDQVTQMLHDAARRNNLAFMQLLLNVLQIDPNLTNRQGMTALHFAARSGQQSVVDYLLTDVENVHVCIKDVRGASAADAARTNGHNDIAELIESKIQQ